MKNKEMEQKICKAFEDTTPNMLDSILADCRKLNREVKPYRKHITSWYIKLACTTAATILVLCFALGLGGVLDIGALFQPYKTGPQNMIIQYSKESCIAIEDNCFYAVGKNGDLYLVRWSDTQALYEGQLVEVSYDTVEKLEYPDGYPSGWTPKYEVTATGVNTYGETIHGQGDGTMCIYAETIGEIKNGVSYVIDINGKIWKILISDRTHLDLPAGDSDSGWIYLNGVTELDAPEKGATYQAASVRIKYNSAEFEDDPSRNPVLTNDLVRMDFDGDGNEEICVLAMGPTSGLMTMQIAIYNLDGSIKYDSIFVVHYDSANTAFFVKDGKLYMIGCCALRYNSNTSLVSGWGYLAIQVALVDGKLKLLDSTGAEWGSIWDGYPVDPEPTDPLPTDPQPTDPAPTEPAPTEPTEPVKPEYIIPDQFPDDLITDSKTLATFQRIFNTNEWVRNALCLQYEDPRKMSLHRFFSNSSIVEIGISDEERAAIVEKTGVESYYTRNAYRLSAEIMEKVLNQTFGISLNDVEDGYFYSLHYLDDSGDYCYFDNGSTHPSKVNVLGIRILENGNTEVYYSMKGQSTTPLDYGYITLKSVGNSYQVVSHHDVSIWPIPGHVPEIPEGAPADLNTNEEVVLKFQRLFYDDSWYTQALLEEYDDPQNIKLCNFLFDSCKPWPFIHLNLEERNEIAELLGVDVRYWGDITGMKASTMEEVVQKVFGLSIADFPDSAKQEIRYLESTDYYYYGDCDSFTVFRVSVAGIRELDNGNIEVYYTASGPGPLEGVVTLKPVGDSYIVISNKGL